MNLLLIEDDDQEAREMAKLIAAGCDDGIRIRHVHTCAGGLQALGEQSFDIVLLDLSLSETNDPLAAEATIASLVKQHSAIPFVLLSGRDNIDEAVHAVRLGVQDSLVKGQLAADRLQRAIRFAIERKFIEHQLDFLAGYDPLTSLVNRQRLQSTAEHALANAERLNIGAALLFIDLDRFKAVNDLWGHATGDELLAAAANRIQRAIRRADTAARLGGDEFVVLLEGADRPAAETVATKILRSLGRPFILAGHTHHITASIGIALYPDDGEDLGALLQNADRAMYAAKSEGDNGWKWPELPGSADGASCNPFRPTAAGAARRARRVGHV